jgi:hypothetical protein
MHTLTLSNDDMVTLHRVLHDAADMAVDVLGDLSELGWPLHATTMHLAAITQLAQRLESAEHDVPKHDVPHIAADEPRLVA